MVQYIRASQFLSWKARAQYSVHPLTYNIYLLNLSWTLALQNWNLETLTYILF